MQFALTLVLTLVLVLLAGIIGLGLVVRFLTGESEAERAVRYDLFAPAPEPVSIWLLNLLMRWRPGPKLLTYRRDGRGRFRKVRR
jgi:hypothetical protein